MKTNNTNQPAIDLDTLISNLKTEDDRNFSMTHKMQQFMWGMVSFYLLVSVIKFFFNPPWYESIGSLIVMFAFLAFGLIFRSYYREYKSIDYGLPTIEMLVKAASRYQLFPMRALFVLIPVILLDLGFSFLFYDLFSTSDPLSRILVIQACYTILMLVSVFSGYLIWRKRQKPIRDHALSLLKEIES